MSRSPSSSPSTRPRSSARPRRCTAWCSTCSMSAAAKMASSPRSSRRSTFAPCSRSSSNALLRCSRARVRRSCSSATWARFRSTKTCCSARSRTCSTTAANTRRCGPRSRSRSSARATTSCSALRTAAPVSRTRQSKRSSICTRAPNAIRRSTRGRAAASASRSASSRSRRTAAISGSKTARVAGACSVAVGPRDRLATMGGSELHRVLDVLADLVARFDREARITFVTVAALEAFGSTPDQLLGRTPVEVSGGAATGPFRELQDSILAAVIERVPRKLEVEVPTSAGPRILEVLHAPEFDADGAVTSVIGIARDITARTRAEAAVLQRERDYRTLAENTPDVIVRWNRELRRTFVNPAFLRVTGMTAEKALGGGVRTELADEPPGSDYGAYLGELVHNVEEVFATGEPRTVALTRRNGRGARILEPRFVPERDELGQVVTVLGIARDITRLLESEREARTLADHSPDLIARFDPKGRYLRVNRTLVELTGIPEEVYLGQRAGDLLGKGSAAAGFFALRAHLFEAIETVRPVETELELDDQGALVSVLGIGREVSARRALENQLVQAKKMEAVGHVAGALAHDFNNMLSVMQLHASIALRAGDLESSWARVRELLTAAERASALTRV